MKTLSVQMQPDRMPDVDIADAIHRLEKINVDPPSIEEGQGPNERYVNVSYVTSDAPKLWSKIVAELGLLDEPPSAISKGTMVVCEGDRGWDNYLLLYHFDKREAIDKFPN